MAIRFILPFLLFLFATTVGGANALPSTVGVRLFSSLKYKALPAVIVQTSSPLSVYSAGHIERQLPPGRYVVEVGDKGVSLRSATAKQAILKDSRELHLAATNQRPLGLSVQSREVPRFYDGEIVFDNSKGDLLVRNYVSLRSYVESCVSSEMPAGFSAEALKAQAVVSTTLCAFASNPRAFEDSTVEQSYLGAGAVRPEVKRAVNAVFGQMVFFDNLPARIFFSSTCGGSTAGPKAVFAGLTNLEDRPYLRGVDCTYCKASPFYAEHVVRINAAKIEQATGFDDIVVESTYKGRPTQIQLRRSGGRSGATSESGYQLWLQLGQALGWGLVPSTRYSIEFEKGDKSAVKGDGDNLRNSGLAGQYVFRSRGCGHGVGLCQWGAEGQARAGRNYRQILRFYFPGSDIKVPGDTSMYHKDWSRVKTSTR